MDGDAISTPSRQSWTQWAVRLSRWCSECVESNGCTSTAGCAVCCSLPWPLYAPGAAGSKRCCHAAEQYLQQSASGLGSATPVLNQPLVPNPSLSAWRKKACDFFMQSLWNIEWFDYPHPPSIWHPTMAPPTTPAGIDQIQFSFFANAPPIAAPRTPPATVPSMQELVSWTFNSGA